MNLSIRAWKTLLINNGKRCHEKVAPLKEGGGNFCGDRLRRVLNG